MHAACVSVLEASRARSGSEAALHLRAADSEQTRGWVPVGRLQQSDCRTTACLQLTLLLCSEGRAAPFTLWRDTLGSDLPNCSSVLTPGCQSGRSPVLSSEVRSWTPRLSLALSERSQLPLSFQPCFVLLQEDVVGTALIRERQLGLVPIVLYFPVTVERFGQ